MKIVYLKDHIEDFRESLDIKSTVHKIAEMIGEIGRVETKKEEV